jgi:hypothetical protein
MLVLKKVLAKLVNHKGVSRRLQNGGKMNRNIRE